MTHIRAYIELQDNKIYIMKGGTMNLPIKAFGLEGESNEVIEIIIKKIYADDIDKTSHLGGYDLVGAINIRMGNYVVNNARIVSSTGILSDFLASLKSCYSELNETAKFINNPYEHNLTFDLQITTQGHVIIEGEYRENFASSTKLVFEMYTDQTYLQNTINELQHIENLYGNKFGKRAY